MPTSKSYQLKDKCLFVDANVYDEKNKKYADKVKPDPPPTTGKIEFAHVMDKSTTPATYLMLNDAAAFIARFLVMGVDTDLIAQIISSEYGSKVKDPLGEVQAVVTMLFPSYLEYRTFPRSYQAPQKEGGGNHSGTYELDFRVNWFVTGGFKGPL
jgi:hypothetical protein